MKKLLASLLIMLLFFKSYGQDDDFLPACVIINGALNLTTLSEDYVYSTKAKPGFSAGACFRTSGDFYFLGGFQYVNVAPLVSDTAFDEPEKITMNYLQFPIMAGIQIAKSKDLKKCLHAQLGGSFTTLLNVSENNFGVETSDFKKTGFTIKTGVGADLWMFVADINYNLLLTKVSDNPGYDNKAKLMCWEFSLGVKIDINKNKD